LGHGQPATLLKEGKMSKNSMNITYHFLTAMQKQVTARYDALQVERTLAFKFGTKKELAAIDRQIDVEFALIEAYGEMLSKVSSPEVKVGA